MTDVVKIGTKFRHKKTKGIYILRMYATIEATMEPAVVYQRIESGELWIRPLDNFFDGRFEHFPLKKKRKK